MPDIFCFKTLKNYYKINSEEIEKINPQNSWSAQKFKADEKSCVMFLHHTTAFYFVLFGVGKNDFEQIETLFVEGFFNQIEKFVALNDEEKISIKKKLTNFTFFDQSSDKDVNNLLSILVSTTKGLNILNYNKDNESKTVEEYYNAYETLYDKAQCIKLKNILLIVQ